MLNAVGLSRRFVRKRVSRFGMVEYAVLIRVGFMYGRRAYAVRSGLENLTSRKDNGSYVAMTGGFDAGPRHVLVASVARHLLIDICGTRGTAKCMLLLSSREQKGLRTLVACHLPSFGVEKFRMK